MNDIKNDLGDVFDMEEKGCLMMCKEENILLHEFQLADEAEKYGLKVQRLRKQEVQELEPEVEIDVAGAVLFKDDCHFDPGKLMWALMDWLKNEGVIFHLNTTVTGFEKTNCNVMSILTDKGKFSCEEVVISTGSWLPEIAKMLGIKLLLQAGKGYSYTYPFVEKNIHYPAILVDGRCAITPWKNKLRIGGTMELSGINNKILINRMKGIYDSARSFYPGLKIDFPPAEKVWNGLRPVTPDGLPYIGKTSSYKNVIFAGGHAMLGISEGAGTGKIVSQLISNQSPQIDISAFRVQRF